MAPDAPASPASDDNFYARVFALVTLLGIGFLLYLIVAPFFTPLAWSAFIAFLLYPLHVRLVRKLHGRTNLSALLLTFATLLILVGPLTGLGAALAVQAGELLKRAQEFASQQDTSQFSNLASVPVVGPALGWLQDSAGISIDQVRDWAVDGARNVLQFFASMGGKLFLGAVGTILGFALMLFFLFFLIRDGRNIVAMLRDLVPMAPARKERLFRHLADVTLAVVYGNGLTSLVQGTLVGIGFAIVGLPSPIVFGVLGFILALIPMAGTPFVWGPAVIILAVQQRWLAAGFLLIWGIGISLIDNFVTPVLISNRARLDTLTVFIGVLGGASAFGAIGVVLGPLALALAIALAHLFIEMRERASREVAAEPAPIRTGAGETSA